MIRNLWWRTLIGIGSLGGGFSLGARAIEWPSQHFWTAHKSIPIAALVVVTFGTANGIFEAVRSQRRERREGLQLKIQQPLIALFVSLLDHLGPEHYKDLGVHAFMVQRKLSPAWPWVRPELVRIGGFQLKMRPHAGVRWTKGKGLIGACWAKNQDVVANLEEDWKELRTLSPEEWDEVDPEERYGLTKEEYERTSDYGAITATPIQNAAGTFKGCISVDSTGPSYDSLWTDRVRENMQNAAQAVARQAKLS
ncbi:MAG: hypothetical protein ABR507_09115 [Actinomycetota bacterium]|nr:hypothetical protein [Actinomycetota bacterium]